MHHDDDPFNRWEAAQKLFLNKLVADIGNFSGSNSTVENRELQDVVKSLLMPASGDRAFLARLLTLPAISYVSEQTSPIDPVAVELSHRSLKRSIASYCRKELEITYLDCAAINTGALIPDQVAARSLRDVCLDYLLAMDDEPAWRLCQSQLEHGLCMTDSASALNLITRSSDPAREATLQQFYLKWQAEPLVIDKWLRAQAVVPETGTLDNVRILTTHPGFDQSNPNRIYSLILGFTHANPYCFHAEDGSGYNFAREWIEILDPANPQVSARLASAFNSWKNYRPDLKEKMYETLRELEKQDSLSRDVREIVSKSLA
jgi:aminopeptidase N